MLETLKSAESDISIGCGQSSISNLELGSFQTDADRPQIDVFDFFSGCGGTSAGLRRAGLTPRAAVDFDPDAIATYQRNFPHARALLANIVGLPTEDLVPYFDKVRTRPVLFSACAPCQPFSKQNRQRQNDDPRKSLLGNLRRFVERFRPELLLVENVPGIGHATSEGLSPLQELIEMLNDLKYFYHSAVVLAQGYGVPQSRRRLIVVASQFGEIRVPDATYGPGRRPYRTVGDEIRHLPPLEAGQECLAVNKHRAAALSELNKMRIRASVPGGSWHDWPPELRLECHGNVKGYSDVYGRLSWDKPAPALTTRCISLSNGRFGHPEQDRAISVREAAYLQTFDGNFDFCGNLNSMAKQIGNAVPVRLAEAMGRMFMSHVNEHLAGSNGED